MKEIQFGSLRSRVLTGRSVYRLIHAKGKYQDEELKLIGIFSSKALAQETAKLLKNKSGFRSSSGRFHIHEIVIDQLGWSEGFIDQ